MFYIMFYISIVALHCKVIITMSINRILMYINDV